MSKSDMIDTIIDYQPFSAVSRWRKQQEGAASKDLKVILCVAVPLMVACFCLAFSFLVQYERQAAEMRAVAKRDKMREEAAIALDDYRTALSKTMAPLYAEHPELRKYSVYLRISPTGTLSNAVHVVPNGSRTYYMKTPESDKLVSLMERNQPYPAAPDSVTGGIPLAVQVKFFNAGNIQVEYRNVEDPVSAGVVDSSVLTSTHKFKVKKAETEGLAGKGLLGFFGAAGAALLLGTIYTVSSKPTHIGLSQQGWRFIWRRRLNKRRGRYLKWSDMARIYMHRPKKSTSPLDEDLCFRSRSGKVHKIKMGAIESIEDRELLLKAIEKWAPQVSRDHSVIQALQPPPNHSYTELWLQALSAPPKREKLKPLLMGTELKNKKYVISQQIGSGGQGHAYLARNEQGLSYVLKECLLPVYVDVSVRRTALEQFENEARLLRQIDHPQIVKLIDFFVEDHRTYLVLEHIDGHSLRQLVKAKGAMSETEVRSLCVQMCEVLKCLHAMNPPVIHRDFTPDNLILHKDGTLKLIDFNVAKQVVESTTSGTVVGKHAYLPPEQFRGMPERASDIYAMGATIYYLLCGKDPEPIASSHPKRERPDLSDSINAIVERATALDTQKRYKTIYELEADLAVQHSAAPEAMSNDEHATA